MDAALGGNHHVLSGYQRSSNRGCLIGAADVEGQVSPSRTLVVGEKGLDVVFHCGGIRSGDQPAVTDDVEALGGEVCRHSHHGPVGAVLRDHHLVAIVAVGLNQHSAVAHRYHAVDVDQIGAEHGGRLELCPFDG